MGETKGVSPKLGTSPATQEYSGEALGVVVVIVRPPLVGGL